MSASTVVDLIFNVVGSTIPQDHGYALYAAIARVVPGIHAAPDIGIFPIRGVSSPERQLRVGPTSVLRLRLPAERIPALLPLAGQSLDLDGHAFRVGVPRVVPLIPAPVVTSPLVTIKLAKPTQGDDFVAPDAFLDAARRKLQERRIGGEPQLLVQQLGTRSGQPVRRVVRIKGQTHVGYGMVIEGLTAEESILIQERGLGGRRLMGCGLFLPVRDTQGGR